MVTTVTSTKQERDRTSPVQNVLLISFAIILTACDAKTNVGRFVSHDSVGVDVIDLHGDNRIRATVIPEVESAGPELQGVHFLHRVTFGRLLETGNAIVASSGTNTIHIIDASGHTIQTIGRPGDGPGEFRGLGEVLPASGDRFLSYDRRTRRISHFNSQGAHVKDQRVEAPPGASAFGYSTLVGVFSDGGFLLSTATGPRDAGSLVPNSFNQAPIILFAVDSIGKITKVYGEFTGEEVYLIAGTEGPFRGEIGIFGAAPYGYTTRFGVQGDRALIFSNRDGTIRAFDRSGQPVGIYRTTWPARTPAKADWERLNEEWVMQQAPSRWEARRSVVANIQRPEAFSAFREAFTASDGTIWLEPFHYWNGNRRTYVGFDTNGSAFRTISTPYRDKLLDVSGERALVLRTSEEGAESIEIVSLR